MVPNAAATRCPVGPSVERMARPASRPKSEYSNKCSSLSTFGKKLGIAEPWMEEAVKMRPTYPITGSQ